MTLSRFSCYAGENPCRIAKVAVVKYRINIARPFHNESKIWSDTNRGLNRA